MSIPEREGPPIPALLRGSKGALGGSWGSLRNPKSSGVPTHPSSGWLKALHVPPSPEHIFAPIPISSLDSRLAPLPAAPAQPFPACSRSVARRAPEHPSQASFPWNCSGRGGAEEMWFATPSCPQNCPFPCSKVVPPQLFAGSLRPQPLCAAGCPSWGVLSPSLTHPPARVLPGDRG